MKMVQSLIALACLLAGADAFGANPTKPTDGPPAFIVHEGVGWCSSDLDENDSVMWKGSTSVVDKTADDCWKECQAEFPQNQEPLLQFYNDGVDTWCICKDGCECMNDVGKDATLAPPDWEAPSACPSPPSPPPPSPPPPSPSYDFIADKAELQAALFASGFTDDGNDYVIAEKYGPIAGWDTSRVEDMSSLFMGWTEFNADISSWDTSGVTDMSRMFKGATAFNQPLNWVTSSVTTMSSMFMGTAAFSQDLNWDTSEVTDMSRMFKDATAFNQQLSFSDTSKVTTMQSVFYGATAFNQPLNWVTSSVTTMEYMFYEAKAFNQPLDFDTSSVTTMKYMFFAADVFNALLSFSDTSKVTDMGFMFQQAAAFDQPLSFDTSSVTTMEFMFSDATVFNQALSFDTSSVTTGGLDRMFFGSKGSGSMAFDQQLDWEDKTYYMFYGTACHDESDWSKSC